MTAFSEELQIEIITDFGDLIASFDVSGRFHADGLTVDFTDTRAELLWVQLGGLKLDREQALAAFGSGEVARFEAEAVDVACELEVVA